MNRTAYKDIKGYKRDKYGKLVHRQVAYQIWMGDRKKYPLSFTEYVIHHKDGKKTNNDPDNLELLTRKEHDKLHFRYGYNNKFLKYRKPNSIQKDYYKPEEKIRLGYNMPIYLKKISWFTRLFRRGFFCERCGREIKHRGNCLACNIMLKQERENGL